MSADEPPDEPVEWAAKRPADALPDVLEHVFLRTRGAREADRERGDLLGIHAAPDLQAIPCATLEALRRDRVRVEVPCRDQVQSATHQPRADHLVLLDRRPELLATEVRQA